MTDPMRAATEAGLVSAINYLMTAGVRMRSIARLVAWNVTEIMYPYVLIGAYAQMADEMRAAGQTEVADALDALRHARLTEMTQPPEDECPSHRTNARSADTATR